jgi:hypothetical protein
MIREHVTERRRVAKERRRLAGRRGGGPRRHPVGKND